jgi:predicted GIY-YIG superfamily endonuclease
MADAPSMLWPGKSGKEYKYWIYTIGTTFTDKKGANYIFAKETTKGSYKPIYIGQTDDLSERFDNHHKMPCIKRNGATHIHVHINTDESSRLKEESDLIEKWNPICND